MTLLDMAVTGIDTSLALHLNKWGVAHRSITVFGAKELVYLVIGLGFVWLAINSYRVITPFSVIGFLRRGAIDGVIILAIPVGIATLLSEIISQIYSRPRPFTALSNIHLLTPHIADGGMPSHHTVFMIAVATAIYIRHRLAGLTLGVLTLLCGVARIASGIHYPTDVLVALVIGIGTVLSVNSLFKYGTSPNRMWKRSLPA